MVRSLGTVVEMFKNKGKHTEPENYRPISLLNTAYKLFARLLQTRLADAIDSQLRKTQYGFRAKRSCSQPIHIIRRIMEQAEATKSPLHMLLLDWEKAFDKIHPQALLTSLKRYGVQQQIIDIIAQIYANPLFRVQAAGTQHHPQSIHRH